MIKAIIFDMDGLLIDSEPIWRQAEKEEFSKVGINLTDDEVKQTMGFRIDEVVAHWFHKSPWQGSSQKDIETKIVDRVIELVKTEGKVHEGVIETLDLFRELELPMAIASSSYLEIINAVVDALGIHQYFVELFSAENETHGKPHPGVFISTAKHLKVATHECLVFEDSPSGVLAAKAAKMKCVAVPDKDHSNHPFINTADLKLSSLKDFDNATFDKLNS